jgi:hypothetical protein
MKPAKKHGVANNKNALKDINPEDVRKLSEKFWTKTEIAAFLNISTKTIDNRFSEIFLKGRDNGKAKLRDIQLRSAMSGNVTMQIWLGKQYLDQTDKTQVSNLSETELERLREIATQEMKQNL